MAEDENGPKHGALSDPVNGPDEPGIKVGGGGNQCRDNDEITKNIKERAPRVLNPAMRRNGSTDLGNTKRGRSRRVKRGWRRRAVGVNGVVAGAGGRQGNGHNGVAGEKQGLLGKGKERRANED